MSFFYKFMVGAALGGGYVSLSGPSSLFPPPPSSPPQPPVLTPYASVRRATLYYQDEIESTTRRLQADLHRLSDQLVRSAPSARGGAIQVDSAAAPVIPQRIPFSEELKARVSHPPLSLRDR